jgi:hypothetical protein
MFGLALAAANRKATTTNGKSMFLDLMYFADSVWGLCLRYALVTYPYTPIPRFCRSVT